MSLLVVLYETRSDGTEIIRDEWESSDRKLLVRFMRNAIGLLASGEWPSFEDLGIRVTVQKTGADSTPYAVTIATPKGCRKARPCVDQVDFLEWEPVHVSETVRARLDADGTAKPLSRLVGHVPLDGNCHGPVPADEYRSETGNVPLHTSNVRDLGALSHMFDDAPPSGVAAWLALNRRQRRGVSKSR